MTPSPDEIPVHGQDLAPIQKQVIDAVREMFERAVSGIEGGSEITDESLVILDDKNDLVTDPRLNESGPLQDCEFGMILVLAREWFGEANTQTDFFNNPRFQKAILLLVRRVVDRVFQVDKLKARGDEGGEGKSKHDGPIAFFTAEPYTKYTKPQQKYPKYSANLDAAMITIAFLAPAVSQFNESLVSLDYTLSGMPDWVKNLRDAAIYVILDGLNYALDCRIVNGNKCEGFTCDPKTRDEHPADGGFIESREFDRLFFTWTACETIRDLSEWRQTYLDKVEILPPAAVVSDLKSRISQLEEALLQAASWCRNHFYKKFEEFTVPETKELVEMGWSPEREEQINRMERDVLHVYHLSQYAAIRSLAPEGVTLEEVRMIADKLDTLVREAIMESGLDAAKDEALFRTLTRNYWLGTSNPLPYRDDAWYPLVVRSLSGLLFRTLRGFERKSLRSDVETLVNAFEDSLKHRVEELLVRRPMDGPSGPEDKLWSFACDQPYVLYATQRTAFALITYGDLLVEIARFRSGGISKGAGGLRQQLSFRAAERLATTVLEPIIDDLIALARTSAANSPSPAISQDVPLPDESWAADTICNLLRLATKDFKEADVAKTLKSKANNLILVRDTVFENSTPEGFPNNASKALLTCNQLLNSIFALPDVGQKLKQSSWENTEVSGILFEHLLRQYLSLPNGSFSEVLAKKDLNGLWDLIERAKSAEDNFRKA